MPAIFPIPTGRVSGQLIHQRLISHLNATQINVLKLQNQLSTGQRLALPSEDPAAAGRGILMQRLIEQKTQAKSNLVTSNSFLSAADNALASVSQSLINIRGTAVTMADSTTSSDQREAAIVEIQRTLEQLVNVGNEKFRGRYLFSGASSHVKPFSFESSNVVYHGNEGDLPSFVDLQHLASTNTTGSEVFGAISPEVKSSVDLNPVLTETTRLADLLSGTGLERGSLSISDGTLTSIIDLTSAETLGDVKRLIESNPPAGRDISVTLTDTGLVVDIDNPGGGNLTIKEVQDGKVAASFGILNELGSGVGPITGTDLNPQLRRTTDLNEILGVRSQATLAFAAEAVLSGFDNSSARIQLNASTPGATLEDVKVQFQAVNGLGFGNEVATYDATARTLTIQVDDFFTTTTTNIAAAIAAEGTFNATSGASASINGASANDLAVTAITASDKVQIRATDPGPLFNGTNISVVTQTGIGAVPIINYDSVGQTLTLTVDNARFTSLDDIASAINGLAEFSAEIDADGDGRINGTSAADTTATATTAGGSGVNFDQNSGLQITNGGQTHTLSFTSAQTVEDVLNILNDSDANVLAEINANGTSINIRSRLSGSDFQIGENGGTTAAELGIRTFVRDTRLTDLNHGFGVASTNGTDFTIRRNDGTDLDIDISNATTIGDVLDLINNHVDNLNPATRVVAQLATFGNGIELVDATPAGDQLTVTKATLSHAAIDLGLIPVGQDQASPTNPGGDPEIITGRDTNPLETKSAFTSLIRLSDALTSFDLPQIQRASAMLDDDITRLNFARAEVGVRGQMLDQLQQQLDIEEVQIRDTLSQDLEVNIAEAISQLIAQQAAQQATLQLVGQTFQSSLLDFI